MPHRSRWKLVAAAVAGVLAARVAGCGGCADAPPPRQPDERLALHYGIPNILGDEYRRVTIADPNRRGVLGQGSNRHYHLSAQAG